MKRDKPKLSLSSPATYQIKVPGMLDKNWLDWDGGMTATIEAERNGNPITTLTITVDQAGLQGLLRYLYSRGLPLISAIWIDFTER